MSDTKKPAISVIVPAYNCGRYLPEALDAALGQTLPPVDLYKVKSEPLGDKGPDGISEYYVVDGHHRVAMARKLGQAFLDARLIEYRVTPDDAPPGPDGPSPRPATEVEDTSAGPAAASPDTTADT